MIRHAQLQCRQPIDPASEMFNHEYEIGFLAIFVSKSRGRVIGFDRAEPSFTTRQHIKKAMVEALRRKDVTYYTRIRGLPDFVRAVSQFYFKN